MRRDELWGEGATAELLVGRARRAMPQAIEALAGIGRLLGAGIGSLVNIFDPELVVVGGGFGSPRRAPAPSRRARSLAARRSSRRGAACRIVRPSSARTPGSIGAGARGVRGARASS